MRQGRGDADYSSLFRQYFPAGGPIGAPSNGEEDQPRLAGIDETKTRETAATPVPVAVETTAEVPSEAKAMGEVVPAPAPEAEAAAQEVAGPTNVAQAPAPTEPVPAPAPKEPAAEAPKEETILKFPTPAKEEDTEEPRGLWGGFWRRQGDE